MKAFQEGDRVRFIPDLIDTMRLQTPDSSGPLPPIGTEGTVATIEGYHGRSIYPDPARSMVYVEWDNGMKNSVGCKSARQLKP